MADLPAPLTPAECDLTDFPYLLVDVVALRERTLRLHPVAGWASVLLMCVAWHQVPAASLPRADAQIARLLAITPRRWTRIKEEALSDWVLCSDGRLYHPESAARALRAWSKKSATARREIRRIEMQSGEWHAMRSRVFARDKYRCTYCGATGARLEADHVEPVSRGGKTIESNLATACKPCNRSKGAKSLAEWRA